MRRFFRRSSRARNRHRWQWIRQTVNNASPNATLNSIDLLNNFKTHAGITINLPDMVIWRLRLKVSITIGITGGTVGANDGILVTSFVDSVNQVVVNQLTDAMDQHDLVYDMLYAYETIAKTTNVRGTGTVVLYMEYDLKSHRRFQSIDDTLWLQLAASGNATISEYSFSTAILTKISR